MERLERQLAKAARAVASSSVLLVAAGAGFSADSGLPTYAGIDEIEPYKGMGITYDRDLCSPGELFDRDPGLWLGFWAKCWNDFAAAEPHEGYAIVRRWSDAYMQSSPLHAGIVAAQQPGRAQAGRQAGATKRAARGGAASEPPEPAPAPAVEEETAPGAAMVYTTNVDGFFVRTFPEHMVYERHGTLATWQCAARPAGKELSAAERKRKRGSLLRLAWSHRFELEGESRRLRAPPLCACCGRPMRPCVMMFGDKAWVGAREGAERSYEAWRELAIEAVLGRRGARLCVLELGAGTRVPTLRRDVEYLVDVLEETGQATVVRVNAEGDGDWGPRYAHCTVTVEAGALAALRRMDELVAGEGGIRPP